MTERECEPERLSGKLRHKTRKVYNVPGHAHELTFSCQGRRPLLRDPRICERLLDIVDRARRSQDFKVWAYVVMPNHVHMLVHPSREEYSISAFLKAIKMPTATYASTLLRTEQPALAAKLTVVRPSGKQELRFWMQGGGYDRNLVSPQAILASYNYIQANPVVAGLASSEHEWTWSSAAALFGNQDLLIPDPLPRL